MFFEAPPEDELSRRMVWTGGVARRLEIPKGFREVAALRD